MKNVLITGANKGIGFEAARQLARLGYFVFIGSRNKKNGEEAISKLKAMGISGVDLLEIDVTDFSSIIKAESALSHKIDALDVLINNAGIAGEQPQSASMVEMDNLRQVFETNFFGVVQTTQQFLPLLKKAKSPLIINVSSELGSLKTHLQTKNPNYLNYDAYSCSKTALNAFTVMLAGALKDTPIKVNSATPGHSATDLNQHSGTQTAEQGAKFIVNCITTEKANVSGKFFKEAELPW